MSKAVEPEAKAGNSRNCAVVGVNWGDEGKGRMVDLLTENYDIVVRYQGGGNAGHTVVNEKGKFALHLLPSGILRDGVVNVLGNGVALDPENLLKEIREVTSQQVAIGSDRLKISDRASLLMPWHRDLDVLEEERLGNKKYGSTRQGIAPFYADKVQKKTILAGELFYPEHLRRHLQDLMEWKNLILTRVYGARPYTLDQLMEWVREYCEPIKDYICNTSAFLAAAGRQGKRILFEAQLGALRDLDQGICPYTTSSNTLAGYAPIGAGAPFLALQEIIGVVKAYSTCVGEGPFVCEMEGEEADRLREVGAEYGAKTGRPRRVGPLDLVATKYGADMQNVSCLAVTKLDVLSYMDKIPVCTSYRVEGEQTDQFPFPAMLDHAEPVIEWVPGWQCDISRVRQWEELPDEARSYIRLIEEVTGCSVRYISVGAQRDRIIIR